MQIKSSPTVKCNSLNHKKMNLLLSLTTVKITLRMLPKISH